MELTAVTETRANVEVVRLAPVPRVRTAGKDPDVSVGLTVSEEYWRVIMTPVAVWMGVYRITMETDVINNV